MSQTIPPTIRLGSKGPDVQRWQKIVGVSTDGDFASSTELATKQWQQTHKLVVDGIVGPASWSTALGIKDIVGAVKVPTASAPTDQWAYQVARRAAPQDSERLTQYVITDARGEGFYGKGWTNPSAATIAASQAHGFTGFEGADSNNWGATQGSGDAGSFPHIDTHADGSQYVGHYKRWSTPEQGYLDMRKVILGGGLRGKTGAKEIVSAIEAGNLTKAVEAQHANGYFELAPSKYLEAMMRNYEVLVTNNGWSRQLAENGVSFFKTWIPRIFGIGVGLIGMAIGVHVIGSKR